MQSTDTNASSPTLIRRIFTNISRFFRTVRKRLTIPNRVTVTPKQTVVEPSTTDTETSTSEDESIPPSHLYTLLPPPYFEQTVSLEDIENSVVKEIRKTTGKTCPKAIST